MDFSIITPSLNYGRFLADCLESVAAQDGVSVEHLVFDAGSTDKSKDIAEDYPNATWIQEPDEGMSDGINKGFDRAVGEWVMWLNADDRLVPGALLRMMKVLKSSTADIVYGDWNFTDEEGEFVRRIKAGPWSNFVSIHHHCLIGSTAAFYRKSTVIDQMYRLRKDFRYVMDGEFYARLHREGKKFQWVPEVIADFRLHAANASMRHLARTNDMDQILAAEFQHVESRAIRRAYGVTLFSDPYLNGVVDGMLWIAAKGYKGLRKCLS